MVNLIQGISKWAIPLLLLGITAWGASRKKSVYESFVAGAKEGWQTALRILPYLIGMLVAIKIFEHSGALGKLVDFINPLTAWLGFPKEVLPLALMRPISGSGSLGLLTQILETYGPDSFYGRLASTVMGSTETSFYVLTVYAGSVGIKKTRHTLPTALTADLAGYLGALYIVLYLFG
ncbi:MAG TPA: spore maturation protein [Firmicutes bacterium]|nr:spore maturation protein [Bacillota bacterium]